MTIPNFCAARMRLLHNVAALQKATRHANRQDASSQRRMRPDANSTDNLHYLPWSPGFTETADCPAPAENVDYVADFRRQCRSRELRPALGAAPVAHLELIVSPAWILETGDLHSPKNPRNLALFRTAVEFCQTLFGTACIVAARADMDEKGGGVVDVLVTSEAHSKRVGRYCSTRPALMALQRRYQVKSAFSALQTAWAEFVQERLDPSIQRGRRKSGVGPDWVTPEIYAAKAELAKLEIDLAQRVAALELEKAKISAARETLEIARAALETDRAANAAMAERLAADRNAIAHDRAEIAAEREELERERADQYAARERLDAASAHHAAENDATEILLGAATSGHLVSISLEGKRVGFATKDPARRAAISAARRAAPQSILKLLAVSTGVAAKLKSGALAELAEEAAKLRNVASREGFRTGYEQGVQRAAKIPFVLQQALDALLEGRLRVLGGDDPRIVPVRPEFADLAAAAQGFAFNHLFAHVEDVLRTLGTYQDAALRDLHARSPN